MNKLLASILVLFLVSACASTEHYTSIASPLDDGVIKKFDVNGMVKITNNQPSKEAVIVYSRGQSYLNASLKEMTDTMVKVSERELDKNARVNKTGATKTIALKILSLKSEYNVLTWDGTLTFEAKLGNNSTIVMTTHYTDRGSKQSLNGSIAQGVAVLFNDQRVRTYLEK